jgi:hypothetical protein
MFHAEEKNVPVLEKNRETQEKKQPAEGCP